MRFDLPRLGEIAGLDVVHLQCHIGTDTLSLARLGARVTGLDFSPEALEAARRLARDAGPAVVMNSRPPGRSRAATTSAQRRTLGSQFSAPTPV